MEQLTIVKGGVRNREWLNHACLSTLSFGSEDMAWTTSSEHAAELMLQRVKNKYRGSRQRFRIEPYC